MHPSPAEIPQDLFDDIGKEQQRYYQKGLEQGIAEANLRDVSQFEIQATQFGKQFGRELAAYEEFTKVFLEDKDGKINHKVKKNLENLWENLQNINLKDLELLKVQRKNLAKKFKVILGMLGVKDYLSQTQQKKPGTDF